MMLWMGVSVVHSPLGGCACNVSPEAVLFLLVENFLRCEGWCPFTPYAKLQAAEERRVRLMVGGQELQNPGRYCPHLCAFYALGSAGARAELFSLDVTMGSVGSGDEG